MVSAEFYDWLEHHKRFFPGVSAWLGKMPLAENEGILSAWKRVLGSVSLSSAKEASEKLYEAETQPKSYERHAAEVKRLANDAKTRKDRATFGAGAVKCQHCKDSGHCCVYVGSTELFPQYVSKYGPEQGPRMTACIACSCEAGNRANPQAKLRHDPGRTVVFRGPFGVLNEETQQAILSGDLAERMPEWSTTPTEQGGF